MQTHSINDIDDVTTSKLIKEVNSQWDHGERDFFIILSSGGGDSYAGIALYSFIRRLVEIGESRVEIACYGKAMSAATLLLIAGSHVRMSKEAWFMVHDETWEGKANAAEKIHREELEVQWAKILAKHSNKTWQFWRRASKKTTYLTAEQCLEYGLIHEVF